jgi:adenylate cyclase
MPRKPASQLEWRRRQRLRRLYRQAEREGLTRLFFARTLALVVIAAYFLATAAWDPRLLYPLGAIAGFVFLGSLSYVVGRNDSIRGLAAYVFVALDVALLCAVIAIPNPFDPVQPPAPVLLRGADGFVYLTIFIALAALSLSPWLVIWAGLMVAFGWGLLIWFTASQPGAILSTQSPVETAGSLEQRLARYLDPQFIDLHGQLAQSLVALLVAGILALAVARLRRVVHAHARSERERGNLARYFSPRVINELARTDDPFGPVRRQEVGVLFVDIVGFTGFAAQHSPETAMELVREFYRRMEEAVFAHDGTLDKYMGDALMATFGVPKPTGRDAGNAIACARAMMAALADWNGQRRAGGLAPLDARVGIDYGPVVLGAVGSERSLAFTVVGDTVNIASRLQQAARDLDASIAVSDAVIEAARREDPDALTVDFRDGGEWSIPGHPQSMRVWTLGRPPVPRPAGDLQADGAMAPAYRS